MTPPARAVLPLRTVMLSSALLLAGCGSVVSQMPIVGLPDDAPPRRERGAFLPVHDVPAGRDTAKLDAAEQARLRAELAAARERQAKAAAAAK